MPCAAGLFAPAPQMHGRLAQLVEHLVYTERVGGSSPSAPTICEQGSLGDCPAQQIKLSHFGNLHLTTS